MEIQLSIILSTFNEMKSGVLPKILASLQTINSFELILIDRFSDDGTVEYIQSYPLFQKCPSKLKIQRSSSNGRGKRLSEGFNLSSGRIILLHHPRSFLEEEGINVLLKQTSTFFWGGFTHRFDRNSPILNFTSWYSNHVRGDIRKIFYLDHCIFASKELLIQTGIPDVEIFEDTLLSLQLKKLSYPIRLPNISTTSSIRFLKNGIVYQSLLNQFMKIGFYLGIPLRKLNTFYERSLELNSKYRGKIRND